MFLVSTKHVKGRNGGHWKCQVFKVTKGQRFNKDTQSYEERDIPQNVTSEIGAMFGIKEKHGNLWVYFGNGTWFMVIEKALMDRFGQWTMIFNVSVLS